MTISLRSIERPIIKDLAERIKEHARPIDGRTEIIYFREERLHRKPRPVYELPIELLRFRKDNGRILSDVLSYEKLHGELNESEDSTQKILWEFLEKKSPSENEGLRRMVDGEGQREPAIITADGFLINGNRRRLILEKLKKNYMVVVILPPFNGEAGPPTVKEIEEIENRYQFRKEGKAEYTGIDRALSMRLKRDKGITIEEQLRDDPQFSTLPERKFQIEVKKVENDLIKPLECVDRYLIALNREGLYDTITETWQAFIDLSKFVEELLDPKFRATHGIELKHVGTFEEIGFRYIRKQDFRGIRLRINDIIRELKDFVKNPSARQDIMRLKTVPLKLDNDKLIGKDGQRLTYKQEDEVWGNDHETELTTRYKTSKKIIQHEEDIEKPIDLLEVAWEKLNHDRLLDPSGVSIDRLEDAERLSRNIKNRAEKLEKTFLAYRKEKDHFSRK